MPDSIKKQIMARVLSNLAPLTPTPFRLVERRVDILAAADVKPSLFVYDGEEEPAGEDNHGRTFRFPLALKIMFESQRNLGDVKDTLVWQVQNAIEDDIQLNGLANILDGGNEVPFVEEQGKPDAGALVFYTVEYRRVRGDPLTTY